MNKWNLSLLKTIIQIIEIKNIKETTFDYLRIVDLNKVKYEKTAKNTLFFLSYATNEDITNGFIIKKFDLREHAVDVIKNNIDYTFVVDEDTYQKVKNIDKAKLIVVDNILNSIDALYKYVLDKKKAQVIAVTGSVGKTTAVGVIADVLREKYNVLRIYSKRITPIILKANLINFLTEEVSYIVLEMSIYHKDHVKILSDLLNPDISALINIDSSHLEFFNSIDDICVNKSSIFRHAKIGFYNNLDQYVNKLKLDNNKIYYDGKEIYKTKMEQFLKIAQNYKVKGDILEIDEKKIKLFYASELTVIQILLAYKIGVLTGIPKHKIVKALNNYQPVENRIQKKIAFNKEIIFDGDVTTSERIRQLANNNYEKCFLIIRKFGSMENNKRFEKVLDYLDSFKKVFIFQDIEYKEMLMTHPKVEIVKNHDFMDTLDGVIIYHYSGYYRSFEEYDEKNLINLENEKYKIMKPEDK